jgi:hypothetical protein
MHRAPARFPIHRVFQQSAVSTAAATTAARRRTAAIWVVGFIGWLDRGHRAAGFIDSLAPIPYLT